MLSYTIANIILHVILISSFIVVFFFTYAAKVEKQIVERQSTAIVKDVINGVTVLLPDDGLTYINERVSTIQAPDMSKEDAEVSQANSDLFKKTIKMLAVVFTIGILIVFIMSKIYKFSMTELLIHNIIIVFFVALTEFTFLTYFAKNYDTIDANYIKYVGLKTIVDKIDARQSQS